MFKTTLTALALAVAVVNPVRADPPLFEHGRQDRAAWEQWFNGLQGDYKTGAFFWASQRSLPNPGTCKQMSDDFYAGCTQAKIRLSPSDALRKTEPDYKAGWNGWIPDEVATLAPAAALSRNDPPVVHETPSLSPSAAAPAPTASQSSLTAPLQQALDNALAAQREAKAAEQQADAKLKKLQQGYGLFITDHGTFINGQPVSGNEVHEATHQWGEMLTEAQKASATAGMRVTLANQEVDRAKKALAAAQAAERQIAEQAERDRVQAETEKAEAAARIAAAQKAAQQQQAQAAERSQQARVVAEAEAESAAKRTEALKAEAVATNEAAAKIEVARRTEAAAQAEVHKATQREKEAKTQVEADKAAAVAGENEIKEQPKPAIVAAPSAAAPAEPTPTFEPAQPAPTTPPVWRERPVIISGSSTPASDARPPAPTPAPAQPVQAAQPAPTASLGFRDLDSIVDASRNNEARFNRDYKGKTFSDAGVLHSVDEPSWFSGDKNKIEVEATNASRFLPPTVYCFQKLDSSKTANWPSRMPIKITGTIYDTVMGNVWLEDCQVKPG